jgi:transposase-like protein
MGERKFPSTLLEFQRAFPDEAACAAHLEKLRWPAGFVCPGCGAAGAPQRLRSRASVLRCRSCLAETRLTAGTIMHRTRTQLLVWFWGAYLVTTHTPGLSAVQFQRQLGIKRYETAFQILHRLRAAMVRPGRDKIGTDGWHVEVDETYVGGRTRGEGRGTTHKILVAGAVEVRVLKKPRRNGERQLYAGRLRLALVPTRGRPALESFVQATVEKGSTVVTDGYTGYDRLPTLGYAHHPITIGGHQSRTDESLPMIHLVFSNLKAWLLGTHHSVSPRHMQAYLNEFVFRFNRRFYPMTAVDSILGIGMKTSGPTKQALYSGRWKHPGTQGETHGVSSG